MAGKEEEACEKIAATRSIPPTYVCLDEAKEEQEVEYEQCQKPNGDGCVTHESYEQCIQLVKSGCETVVHTMMCPPTHMCLDASD